MAHIRVHRVLRMRASHGISSTVVLGSALVPTRLIECIQRYQTTDARGTKTQEPSVHINWMCTLDIVGHRVRCTDDGDFSTIHYYMVWDIQSVGHPGIVDYGCVRTGLTYFGALLGPFPIIKASTEPLSETFMRGSIIRAGVWGGISCVLHCPCEFHSGLKW